MRVDRLVVRNFRCFQERAFHFHPEFNVLIGDNGSGKTAILEALAVSAGSWFLGVRGQGSRHIRRPDVRLSAQKHGDETSFEEQYPVEICSEGMVSGESLDWRRTLMGPEGRTTYGDALGIKKLGSKADVQVRNGETVVLPVIAYYGTGRLWLQPRDTATKRLGGTKRELSRFEGYRDSIDDRVSSRELTRWMERQDRLAYQEKRESNLYRVVREVMSKFVEDATDVVFDNRRLEVIVFFENSEPQPFSHLSDGQRNMLALAGDLAMRMARLNPHLGQQTLQETPGIALIDELDLHLHPTWQRHVVQDLRNTFPKVQFITTSHSPFIVQTLGEGQLLSLDEVQPVPQFENLGLEEIAGGLMGVEHPEVSPRYLEMVEAAKSYLMTLEEAAMAPEDKLNDFKDRLAAHIAPFADNPAFQAILEMKRVAKLGG